MSCPDRASDLRLPATQVEEGRSLTGGHNAPYISHDDEFPWLQGLCRRTNHSVGEDRQP